MALQRKLIRQAVARALSNATAARDRVFPTREAPFRESELPALAVYALDESVDPESKNTSPRELHRTLSLAVVAVVMLNERMDDALDDLAEQIEAAIAGDETLAGTASDAMLVSTEIAVDDKAARPVGMARLTFSVSYFTYPTAGTLDDLATVEARTNLGGALPAGDEARDVVQLETEP